MKCKKCSSDDLVIVDSGPHSKVICGECWTFQKFIPKNIADNLHQIKISQANDILDSIPEDEGGKSEIKYLEEIYFKLDLILDHLGITE